MTPEELHIVMIQVGIRPESKTAAALHMVLVEGKSQAEASRKLEINQSVVSRAIKKIPKSLPNTCPCCGAPLTGRL